MTRTETIIAVENVPQSSQFYRDLLQCESAHGGETFEVLKDKDDTVILCLHKWGDHNHPTMMNADNSAGNGLILFIRVSDLNSIFENAQQINANIEKEIHFNENSGKHQFILRDPDGYYLIISE
ncbi:MAG: glyoxalase [Bacteroidia bacterium]|nr:glyoxalase [Bacteroidia bacterium]